MKTLLLIITGLLTAFSTFAAELNFSSLENGDSVELTLHARGCFQNSTSWYEIRKSNGTCSLTKYAITWDKSVPAKIIEKKAIGELQLTQSDIAGLDSLLGYFRSKKQSSTTTLISLQLEYYEGGRRIRVENLEDESGGFDLRNRKDIVSFHELIERFHSSTNRPSAQAQ
ncbi:MAG: hypothetical protein J0L73_28305 [Verrucomicrobia bacterium]|nr:hypothetical protein [Verrucomicrobiota bacterium]